MASSHRSGKFRRLLSTTSGYASPASSGSSLLPSAPSPPSVQPGVCASVGHAVCSAASTSLSASATVSLVGDSIGSTSGGAPRYSSTDSSGSSLLLYGSSPPSAQPLNFASFDTRSALPLAAHRFRRQPRFHRPLTRSDRPPA